MAEVTNTLGLALAQKMQQGAADFESSKKDLLSVDSESTANVQNKSDEKNSKRKHLRFSSEIRDQKIAYTPLTRPTHFKKRDTDKVIRELWVRLSQAGQYEQLRNTLLDFELIGQKMVDFFNKEGSFLLLCGTLYWDNPQSLAFIYENVPGDVLKQVLRQKNYSSVEAFLLGETGLEKSGSINEMALKERREKLDLLLKIDPEGLNAYMASEYFNTRFAEGVKTSFREAVQESRLTQLNNKLRKK